MSGTVDSSVVRMEIGLADWVLGRIFGTGEREAERYVTLRGLCVDSRLC